MTQPDASIGTDGSNIEGASADPTQYGGVDGMTEFQALDDNLFDGSRAGDTLSSTNLLRMVSTITEAPAVFLFGLCSGYFLGFLIVLFVFARDLRLDFRYGGAVGLALNVFLGMMLPHTSVVAFRSPH